MDRDFVRAAQASKFNRINGSSVAKHIGNQMARSSSFDRTFRTALRLQNTAMADSFFDTMMQELSKYTLSNSNQLPRSFSTQKLGELYLRLKVSGTQMSPGLTELLLFALNKKGMHKEIIDLCSDKSSDIHKYYLAESLLQGKVKGKSYYEALTSSSAFADDQESACQLTQKTKALLLDGSDQRAMELMRRELAKREETAKSRKELLIALYDDMMEAETGQKLTFQEFKEKRQKSALASKRLVQQLFAV